MVSAMQWIKDNPRIVILTQTTIQNNVIYACFDFIPKMTTSPAQAKYGQRIENAGKSNADCFAYCFVITFLLLKYVVSACFVQAPRSLNNRTVVFRAVCGK